MSPEARRPLLVAALLALATVADAVEPATADSLADLLIEVEALLTEPADTSGGFEYSADAFIDYVEGDSILLRGHAVVVHRGARLEAPEMVYRRADGTVEARAATDSAAAGDGPLIRRGSESLRGHRILYHLDSGRGLVRQGRVEFEDGFYTGRLIRTLSEEEFHVHAGSYTTCDLPEPHYDFYSPRIKVLAGDMAIARPVYFRIAGRRVVWVPFYVFSLRQDRQSGLLTPGYGSRAYAGGTEWEVRNLGYYFAPSDYWDLSLSADLREHTGWLTRASLAYAWRYHFSGQVETRFQLDPGTRREWWASVRHSQELGASASLRADGTYQSTAYRQNNSNYLTERLNRTRRLNLRFDKRWREAGYSLSVTGSHTDNPDADRSRTVLPDVSLRSNRKALIPGPDRRGGGGRQAPWYANVYYDASARLRRARSDYGGRVSEAADASATLRLTTQQRPTPWLNLSSGLTESWRDADLTDGDREAVRTDRFDASASLSQTLYGMFYPQVWRLAALRHVLKPDLGLSYSATRADTGGVVGFGGRARPWDQRRRIDLRLTNSFWAKVLDHRDEESKVRLAQLNLSTSYDLDRDHQPLSDLSTTVTVNAGRRLDTRLSLRSGFYRDNSSRLRFPRRERVELSTTVRLVGVSGTSGDREGSHGIRVGEYGYESGLQQDPERTGARRQLQLSHYYSKYRGSEPRSWLRGAAGGTVRGHWHLRYSLNYSLDTGRNSSGRRSWSGDRVTAEVLSIQREFHDWTATLTFSPFRRFGRDALASDRSFYFRVALKDIPQIRWDYEQREQGY